LLAILVLRWEYGYIAVKFVSDEITKFLEYAYEGAASIFGDPWMIFHAFVFMAMPLLIYVGAVMSILYYYGLTQLLAMKIAWLMQKTMHTTAIETLSVASNIFLNGVKPIHPFPIQCSCLYPIDGLHANVTSLPSKAYTIRVQLFVSR
jgi:pyrimidine nucleoside transport protein